MIMNVVARRKAQGGSTITQQLARVLFLTPEKNFSRKIKEALLAVEIEKHYSKDKILELYFNQVYFGHGAYGVEAAAQTYFQKSVGELNLAEAAMLAGLPSAPNRFSPILDPARARRRRDHVLNRMVEQKYITQEQADAASRTPFDETLFTRNRTIAPYFVEHVRQQLEETYGAYALYNSGLKVYTTLNLKMQRAAEEALVGGLRDLDKSHGYPPARRAQGGGGAGPHRPLHAADRRDPSRHHHQGEAQVPGGPARPLPGRDFPREPEVDEAQAISPGRSSEGGPVLVQVLSVDERRKTVGLRWSRIRSWRAPSWLSIRGTAPSRP